jgi:hypothetical protein
MNETTVVIRLQLDEGEGVLAGCIEARGEVAAFEGWVGLVALLDRLLSRERRSLEGEQHHG